MQFLKIGALMALVVPLAACDTEAERAVVGAAAGAAIADITDNDVATGAAIGAAAGVFCDDLNVPGCTPRY